MRIYTTKIYTPAPSFEKMFLLFAARQTLQNMHFDWASYSSQSNRTNQTSWMGLPGCGRRRFLFLCRLLRLIRRGRRRHRLCIISQVRFVGLTFFRNAAFEEPFWTQVMISSILSSFKTSCKITCSVLILTISRNKRQIYVISWAREIILVGFFLGNLSSGHWNFLQSQQSSTTVISQTALITIDQKPLTIN